MCGDTVESALKVGDKERLEINAREAETVFVDSRQYGDVDVWRNRVCAVKRKVSVEIFGAGM